MRRCTRARDVSTDGKGLPEKKKADFFLKSDAEGGRDLKSTEGLAPDGVADAKINICSILLLLMGTKVMKLFLYKDNECF